MHILSESAAADQIYKLCIKESPDLLLIAGCTGCGKSTLTKQLSTIMQTSSLCLDNYFKNENEMEIVIPELSIRQWDSPNCYKWDILITNLQEIFKNKITKIPKFSHQKSIQIGWDYFSLEKTPLILEGIYSMSPQILDITKHLRLKIISIFIDIPAEIRWNRKYHRDVQERKENPNILRIWFDQVIRPAEEKWIQEQSLNADIKIINSSEE